MKSSCINLIAAFACLICAAAYTMTGKSPGAVVPLVFVGLVNVGFALAR